MHPRRGGTPVPPAEIAAGAPGRLRALVEHKRERIEELLGHPEGDEDLVVRARRHLGGDPGWRPEGRCGRRPRQAQSRRRHVRADAAEHEDRANPAHHRPKRTSTPCR
ncbi:hypothetical protein GCM10022224_055230 [Nonomuraea antimicrobica]|uniref:Uncharacterized protein n=1 Tax=Nonomuraea antimicrobica TaxID=561173 RepID=A0ABP7C8R4_9ACTN